MELSNIDDGNLAETSKTFTKIFNLSNRKLNDIEKGVLMMGLKFTPTPEKNNSCELDDDVNAFIRKIRLCEYFDGEENNDVSLVRNKSNFTPPSGRNEILDTSLRPQKHGVQLSLRRTKKLNITLL